MPRVSLARLPLLENCTLGEAAVEYARHGVAVVPCNPGEKRPQGNLAPHGVHSASADPEVVGRLWNQAGDLNVGLALGQVSGGLVALDVDDPEVATRVGELAQQHGWPAVRTPSGGCHVYAISEAPVRTAVLRSGGRAIGELRGEGTYVLAPPSVVDGRQYRWISSGDLPRVTDPLAWAKEVLRPVFSVFSQGVPLSVHRSALLVKVPPFPLHALPDAPRRYVEEVTRGMDCPPDLVAVPLLGAAGGAWGNRLAVRLTSTWVERAITWTAVVADPGSAKSPALEAALAPFVALQREAYERWQGEVERWKREVAAARGERGTPPPVEPDLEHYFTSERDVRSPRPHPG